MAGKPSWLKRPRQQQIPPSDRQPRSPRNHFHYFFPHCLLAELPRGIFICSVPLSTLHVTALISSLNVCMRRSPFSACRPPRCFLTILFTLYGKHSRFHLVPLTHSPRSSSLSSTNMEWLEQKRCNGKPIKPINLSEASLFLPIMLGDLGMIAPSCWNRRSQKLKLDCFLCYLWQGRATVLILPTVCFPTYRYRVNA